MLHLAPANGNSCARLEGRPRKCDDRFANILVWHASIRVCGCLHWLLLLLLFETVVIINIISYNKGQNLFLFFSGAGQKIMKIINKKIINKKDVHNYFFWAHFIRRREAPPEFFLVLDMQNTGICLKITKKIIPGPAGLLK